MKHLYILLICMIGCTRPQQSANITDSLTVLPDSIATDTTDTATYELTAEENRQMQEAGAAVFSLAGSVGGGTLLETDVTDVIRQAYYPDNMISEYSDDSELAYLITSAETIEGDFISRSGSCAQGSALFCTQSKSGGEEEEYQLFFVNRKDGKIVVNGPEVFTGSYAQTSASAAVTLEYKLSENCAALAVETDAEGGDIDLSRDAAVTFYILDEHGIFYEVLKLITEETHVSEYEVTGDENKNSTSETRTFEIVRTRSNGLHDIKAHMISKTNGEIVEEKDELYQFDGRKYVEQIN